MSRILTRKQARKYVTRTKMRNRVHFKGFLVLGTVAVMAVLSLMNNFDTRAVTSLNAQVTNLQHATRRLSNATVDAIVPECADETKEGYLPELFTCEQKKQGATIFYVLGVVYMFLGLSIVCDEFFVPALEGFVDAFNVSDDVAGATFMAAGGSAPELFTSFIGVFVAKSNVGFGTIVGSAVFNVLFVIGMCAMFSKEVLQLTWWPLFRDCLYYTVSLVVLALFFGGDYGAGANKVELWESIVLLLMYAGYVILMKYNEVLHQKLLKCLTRTKTSPAESDLVKKQLSSDAHPFKRKTIHKIESGVNVFAHPARFRAGILQSLFNSSPDDVVKRTRSFVVSELIGDVNETFEQIDKNGDEKIDRKELSDLLRELTGTIPLDETLDAAMVDMQIDQTGEVTKEEFIQWYKQSEVAILKQVKDAYDKIDSDNDGRIDAGELKKVLSSISFGDDLTEANVDKEVDAIMAEFGKKADGEEELSLSFEAFNEWYVNSACFEQEKNAKSNDDGGNDDDDSQPLDISFPDGIKARIVYFISAPLIFTLYFTVPDTRNPKWKKWYVVSFVNSIIWIGIYSYFMVWWAEVIGIMAGIPDTVMGLAFLAAGTSIPDLLSSVIVARQGLGDMAVSSSVGSNIFDILMGLPIPWFFYSVIYGEPMAVTASGLLTSVLILIVMLVCVVTLIAVSGWKMTKGLGAGMFALYFLFLGQDLLRSFNVVNF